MLLRISYVSLVRVASYLYSGRVKLPKLNQPKTKRNESKPEMNQTMSEKSSQNGLRRYAEILPHQTRPILSYLERPISHIGHKSVLAHLPVFSY